MGTRCGSAGHAGLPRSRYAETCPSGPTTAGRTSSTRRSSTCRQEKSSTGPLTAPTQASPGRGPPVLRRWGPIAVFLTPTWLQGSRATSGATLIPVRTPGSACEPSPVARLPSRRRWSSPPSCQNSQSRGHNYQLLHWCRPPGPARSRYRVRGASPGACSRSYGLQPVAPSLAGRSGLGATARVWAPTAISVGWTHSIHGQPADERSR